MARTRINTSHKTKIMQDCKLKKINSCFLLSNRCLPERGSLLASDTDGMEVTGMTDRRATKPLLKLIHSLGTGFNYKYCLNKLKALSAPCSLQWREWTAFTEPFDAGLLEFEMSSGTNELEKWERLKENLKKYATQKPNVIHLLLL